MEAAIESYKEMADFGGNLGIKVTFENHWGLAADPMNLRIMVDTINHPYCDVTPDFCNWEHEYMLFNGLKALAPYSTSNVHAKYWDRWGDKNDVQAACLKLATHLTSYAAFRARPNEHHKDKFFPEAAVEVLKTRFEETRKHYEETTRKVTL